MTSLTSVIIVTHNHDKYIKKCLNSLEKVKSKLEIIIIDNASIDRTIDIINRFHSCHRLIVFSNTSNIGFSRATNQAINLVRGRYILLINPDTEVAPGSLELMINFFKKNKSFSCLVPKLINPDNTLQRSVRNFPTVFTFIVRRTPIRWTSNSWAKNINHKHLSPISYSKFEPIPWALGGCIFIRKTLFDMVGLFDDNFFLYCEDIDWFYRLKQNGFLAYYYPEAVFIHHHQATSDKSLISIESYYHFRSMLYFFGKYWRQVLTGKY